MVLTTNDDNDNGEDKYDDSADDDQPDRVVESPTELLQCPKLLSSWLTSLIRKFHPMMMVMIMMMMMTKKQNDDVDDEHSALPTHPGLPLLIHLLYSSDQWCEEML